MDNLESEKQTNGYYSDDQIAAYNKMTEAIHEYVSLYGKLINGVQVHNNGNNYWMVNFIHDMEKMREHQGQK